ncbi:hypothetical protein F8388_007781 [Cannabis sativa]|uniref:Uncharacterized protein n=1 Tax=Cannabis sativa TaxID=3483 RepID=A0A7J6FT69_CANSA|nr:hypothetical protein F8388_007781 [Cannabis sativa]
MDTQPNKTINELGEVKSKVDSVDHQSSAGQGQEMRHVQVIHHSHPSGNSSTTTTTGGVLAGAAAAAAVSIQCAKDALSGK